MPEPIDPEVQKSLKIVKLLGDLQEGCERAGITFSQIAPMVSLILDGTISTKEEIELVVYGFKEGLKK